MESGGHIWYVDYATGAELRKKYKDEPIVNLDEIVETIFRWGERSLQELVDNKQFDYVIASHVIEHVPDMLGWLKEIAAVLKDKGILSLAIPDKRYTFDYLHELSTPGMMIEAYLSHPRQPGPREVFDHYAFMIQVDPIAVWEGNQDNIILKRVSPIQEAFELAQDSLIAGHYHDAHVSVFPLASFLDLLEIAIRLNLFDFILVDFYSTVRNTLEFFVSLERLPRDENHDESLARKLASISWARERAS
jgi:SAM-dependent methyltransferase